jgi:hypothetical protein
LYNKIDEIAKKILKEKTLWKALRYLMFL